MRDNSHELCGESIAAAVWAASDNDRKSNDGALLTSLVQL